MSASTATMMTEQALGIENKIHLAVNAAVDK
jgi:hypothetical protein